MNGSSEMKYCTLKKRMKKKGGGCRERKGMLLSVYI